MYIAVLLLVIYIGDVALGMEGKERYEETRQSYYEIQKEKRVLEDRLDGAQILVEEYEEKRRAVRELMDLYGITYRNTGLEQYVLACMRETGLEPVKTRITTFEPDSKSGYRSVSMEAEGEGSLEAAVMMLDELEGNQVLYGETCELYPVEGSDKELWRITLNITCLSPASWEEAEILAGKKEDSSEGETAYEG